MQVTEDDIQLELASSTKAAIQMKNAVIVFENLLIDTINSDGKESPVMECFLQNCQLRVQRRDRHWQVILQCPRSEGSCCISTLLAEKPNFEEISINAWAAFKDYCQSGCSSVPAFIRLRLEEGELDTPPLDNLTSFFRELKSYLKRVPVLRGFQADFAPKRDTELHVPLSTEFQNRHGRLPFYKPPIKFHTRPKLEIAVGAHDVIVGDDLQRDLPGNRRFRALISEHRALYRRVSKEQKQLIAETLVGTVERKGGSFNMLDMGGCAYRISGLEHTTNALEKGFPFVLDPHIGFEVEAGRTLPTHPSHL